MSDSAWQVFNLPELLERIGAEEPCYLEYLRMPGLSSGVYRLPAGSKDMQAPHLEDLAFLLLHVAQHRHGLGGFELFLRFVHLNHLVRIEHVVERNQDGPGTFRALDHGFEGLRVYGDENDGVVTGCDLLTITRI